MSEKKALEETSKARRAFLSQAGTALASIPMITLIACSSDRVKRNALASTNTESTNSSNSSESSDSSTSTDSSSDSSTSGSNTESTSSTPSTETSSSDSSMTGEAADGVAWATGGTLAMKGNYADPFAEGIGSTCTIYRSATLGPCYAKTQTRKDITEGEAGLPTRFAFLIVDSNCKAVADATVDIWHCSPSGLYSGDDANAMCTNNDSKAKAARWFRGVQVTDKNGRVDFDTCFPGWYSSRTVHLHFTVTVGGVAYITSQLFFEDALNNEIIGSQVLYKERGSKDTTNAKDKVIIESSLNNYYFQTKKMADGALLAYKAIVIKS